MNEVCLSELRDLHVKLDTIDDFKQIVQQAIENEDHFKSCNEWLDEEYIDCSRDGSKTFRAMVICINETYDETIPHFNHGYKKVKSLNAYDIWYTDISNAAGGFIANNSRIGYSAIKAIKKLVISKKFK